MLVRHRSRPLLGTALLCALGLSGLIALSAAAETPERVRQEVVVVGGGNDGSECRAGQVGQTMAAFTETLRRGDLDKLEGYWQPRFASFGVGDRASGAFVGGEAVDEALASVESAGRLPIRLRAVDFDEGGSVAYQGAWTADGRDRAFGGKGEIGCDEGNVWVFQAVIYQRSASVQTAPLCPQPRPRRPQALVVCRR